MTVEIEQIPEAGKSRLQYVVGKVGKPMRRIIKWMFQDREGEYIDPIGSYYRYFLTDDSG